MGVLVPHLGHAGTSDEAIPDTAVRVTHIDPDLVLRALRNDGDGYNVWVDLSNQVVHVYEDGVEIRRMTCSTGIPNGVNNTPTGRFEIDPDGRSRGPWFFSAEYPQGAKFCVGFIGTVDLFHSVPMDEDGSVIDSEAALLGSPASHGCIRLSPDDALWFYRMIPAGSDLWIDGVAPVL